MKPLLEVENVRVSYGSQVVVSGVSLSLHSGELCALLGLNGSGKTTLLRAICGLLKIDGGACRVAGTDITVLNEYRKARLLSYIPQRHSPIHGLSVQDVVLMGFNPYLGLLESPGEAERELAAQALRRLEIGRLAAKRFEHLSEGQKQLVILARALVQNTPVMLLDEPDSALDFLNRHQVLAKIRQLIHEEQKAGLITLHDANFALAYCDRLILLKDGRIANELMVGNATASEVKESLQAIYGDILVLEYQKQGEKKFMIAQE